MGITVTEKIFEDAFCLYENQLYVLGARVREERIVPLCRANGWSFISGMGTWFIRDKDGNTILDSYGDYLSEELKDLWELLNHETMVRNSCVADYMEDFRS